LDNILLGRESQPTYLDGGAGADTMIGGWTNDTYVVDAVGDAIIEKGGSGGGGTVRSRVSYTLGAMLENLILTGGHPISGIGNEANKRLDGATSVGANVVAGGRGDDTYVLGVGDSVIENAGAGSDTVEIAEGSAGTYTVDMFPNIENLRLGAALNASNL